MKLKKALAKAKANRQRMEKTHAAVPQASDDGATAPVRKQKEKAPLVEPKEVTWTAPVYSRSRAVSMDQAVLKDNRCVCIETDSAEIECYKVLRAKIQQLATLNNWRTIMITSPQPGDGKTVTSVNLALTFAKAYQQTVLLVDCDLKRQGVHKCLGIDSRVDIQDYLVDDTPLEKIIVWPEVEKLSLISGGKATANSAEVLGSPQMKTLVGELKERYEDRIVFIDTPPLLAGADALAIAPLVDGIVMVVAEGKTSMSDLHQALEMIPKEKMMGYVMNRQAKGQRNGYYYY